ncbi:FAD-binding and (Fe-S)-binding domain-containing protein [Labilibaculum sp.]|uniref:FAD-binding and (Fe-S)-binding domain-containing protein n=1 Tax=Labilibaculum sp. TaxID=2060723 RepID=UPI003564386E
MLTGEYKVLHERLLKKIDKNRMFHDPLHTLAWGTDASFYRLIPKLVIKSKSEVEVSEIMRECDDLNIPVTYRAAGTSLSGQALSDSVLVIAGDFWKKHSILEKGAKIRLQPGITGARANALLAPYGKKIGPDPASINAAMIGGIAANNASGMCCGTSENSYKTIDSIRVILHDGTILDTSSKESVASFKNTHLQLLQDISQLAKDVRENKILEARIREKFKMKNTTGYSLNALVDYKDPIDILTHLMIGSEGTLGFISELVYRTVVEHKFKASSLMIFPDIEKACRAVSRLKSEPVAAVELMDRAALRSVENDVGVPAYLKTLSEGASAILVESRAEDANQLQEQIAIITKAISEIPVEIPVEFTNVPAEFAMLWKIRKGLLPTVGGMRKVGTTVIIEDVCFPVPKLAEATLDLQKLFKKYHYSEAVIFGHALEGNLHFVFTQDFGSQSEIDRYAKFMDELAELVVARYDGALKAEHGTGRNMAPYVEMEWGTDAYNLMKQIKAIFDPRFLINPGVILNADKQAHLKDLKPLPAAHEKIDQCMECGFCEPACVSHNLTLSPRQRIATYREITRLKASGEKPHELASMIKQFDYEALQLCATDGLCALSCPVKIDTGKLVKELRADDASPKAKKYAMWCADNMDKVQSYAKMGLNTVNFFHSILGSGLMGGISGGMRTLSGNAIPRWTKAFPKGAPKIVAPAVNKKNPKKVVYFPSCINRSMGTSKDYDEKVALTHKMEQLIKKAGYEIIYPEDLSNQCCGMAFLSKGFKEAGMKKSNNLEAALSKASENGKYPILCDMSPCLYTMKENMEPRLKLYEPIEFIMEYLKDNLHFTPVDETVSVFAVCSAKKMGVEDQLVELAQLCAKKVVKPDTNCCGFAGDRGFTHPDLNDHGLRDLRIQHPTEVKHGYSTSRTCEIGLTLNSGVSYQSIAYLVDRATTSKT